MHRKAVFADLYARPGREAEVAAFVRGYISLAAGEPATTAWFGGRSSPSTFAIFGVFPDERGRHAHLAHGGERRSTPEAAEVLAGPPDIQMADILAVKICEELVSRGLYVAMAARTGRESHLEECLATSRALVEHEPETIAWFAVRFGPLRYGTFAFFSQDSGRRSHLNGPAAAVLRRRELLAQDPTTRRLDILAAKLQREPAAPPNHDSRWLTNSLRPWLPVDDPSRSW